MIALGLALWPAVRGWNRSVPSVGGAAASLGSPLARELARQSITPRPGTTFRTELAPILAFELFPLDMRDLYDRSRALDVRLLTTLSASPEDAVLQRRVRALQTLTRDVRRRLVLIMIDAPGEGRADRLDPLKERIEIVERCLVAM